LLLGKRASKVQFIKSWKFAAILVAALTVCAVGLIAYGVTTHEEAGFMETTPNWQANDFPLATCVASYNTSGIIAYSADLEVSRYAMSLVNQRLGFNAYRLGSAAECKVNIILGVPTEAGWQDSGGVATINRGSCTIEVANVIGELKVLTLYHELGHCLGLDHDDFEASIMRPTQSVTPEGSMPPWISDSDRSLIRSTYLGE
jgi:hypothetical protein